MDNIGKIILNHLTMRDRIWLPEAGTLWVDLQPAVQQADGTVKKPYNVVMFSQEFRDGSLNIIDLLEGVTGWDRPTSEKYYYEWLSAARRPDGFVIKEVGEVKNGVFLPSEHTEGLFNPRYDTVVPDRLKPAADKKGLSKAEKTWITLIVLFVIILAGGWSWWYLSKKDTVGDRQFNARNPAATDNLDRTRPAPGSNEGVVETGAFGEANEVGPEEGTAAAVTEPAKPDAPANITVPAASAGSYIVVGGVFSIPENADKYITQMKKKYPDLEYGKHPYYNGKTIVSLYSSRDEKDANRNRRAIEDKIREYDLWVYKLQ